MQQLVKLINNPIIQVVALSIAITPVIIIEVIRVLERIGG